MKSRKSKLLQFMIGLDAFLLICVIFLFAWIVISIHRTPTVSEASPAVLMQEESAAQTTHKAELVESIFENVESSEEISATRTYASATYSLDYDPAEFTVSVVDESLEQISITHSSSTLPRIDIQTISSETEIDLHSFTVLARAALNNYFADPLGLVISEDTGVHEAEGFSISFRVAETTETEPLMVQVRLLAGPEKSVLALCLIPESSDQAELEGWMDIFHSLRINK